VLLSAPIDAGAGQAPPPPLEGNWIERIDLDDGRVVYVTPPVGATEPRPIVVAIHGAVDDAGLMCSAWRIITDVYPFVVCPSGRKLRKDTYVWSSSEDITSSVARAVKLVKERYGERVADGPMVYAAFSQGANMAGPVLGHSNFRRAVLTEGGAHAFDEAADARRFADQGAGRVLFTCSHAGCAGALELARASFERAGGQARVTYSGAYGHSIVPQVRESIHAALPWVVADLDGWEGYATAPKLVQH
jgi:hypothetical protein